MTSLLCLIGKHEWAGSATEDGERYQTCRRCGAVKDDPPPPDFGVTGPPTL